MCTLVILRRPDHQWPLLLAGNRDEMRDRPSLPPARHWADRPEMVAGQDLLGGGAWFGVNDFGVAAAVMNREGTLGPETGKRTRGELVLEALDHAEAVLAGQALSDLEPEAYRPFNLFVGDPMNALWVRNDGTEIRVNEVPPGLHMLASGELDDLSLPRLHTWLPRFRAAPEPDPAAGDWKAWERLMASRLHDEEDGPRAAMNLELPNGFATVSSQLLALPQYPGFDHPPLFWYADGAPDRVHYQPVDV